MNYDINCEYLFFTVHAERIKLAICNEEDEYSATSLKI